MELTAYCIKKLDLIKLKSQGLGEDFSKAKKERNLIAMAPLSRNHPGTCQLANLLTC